MNPLRGIRIAPWWSALVVAAVFVALNAALGFENRWPTFGIVPKAVVSPEILLLVGALAGWVTMGRAVGPLALRLLAGALLLAIVGRYLQVTAPALFGRPFNVYWDGQHLPQVLLLAASEQPPLRAAAIAIGSLILFGLLTWLMIRFLAWVLGRLCDTFRVRALARAAVALSLGLLIVWGVGRSGGAQAVGRYFSQPVSFAYLEQAWFVAQALTPGAVDRLLPASPAFAGDVEALGGADVLLLFLESYGAVTVDDSRMAAALRPARERLGRAAASGGFGVVSAFVRSPTFGGGSWLAHSSLLSGVAMDDPARYHLLLTTGRPTLVSQFREHGYEAVGWMPGLQKEWPEGSFYGYDRIVDAEALDYRGPVFGFWRIPDQYSIARLGERELHGGPRKPRFIVFPIITSHVPFQPLPPYVHDASRLLHGDPGDAFDAAALASALAHPPDWSKLTPAYTASVDYTLHWLADFLLERSVVARAVGSRATGERAVDGGPSAGLHAGDHPAGEAAGANAQTSAHPLVIIALGDHQPTGAITGPAASWDVPVHVFARDPQLLERLVANGFARGLDAPRVPLGHMAELTARLSAVFAKPRVNVAGAARAHRPVEEPGTHLAGAPTVGHPEAQRLAR